jgi:hypothetical protein
MQHFQSLEVMGKDEKGVGFAALVHQLAIFDFLIYFQGPVYFILQVGVSW